jgi:hypothetical protein
MNLDLIKDKLGLGEDKLYGAIGTFSEPEELVSAGRKIREMGYTKLDAMSPFPVHGIDDAIGVPRSKLGWIVIGFSALGGLTALLLIWYVGVISYPLVIGGKPLFAVEFAVPITFELTILCSAFAAVFGMFGLNRLPRLYHPVFNFKNYQGATDDRFLLAIEASDSSFDPVRSVQLLREAGARSAEVVEA